MAKQQFLAIRGMQKVGNSVNWKCVGEDERLIFTNGRREIEVAGNWLDKVVIFECDGENSKFLGERKKPNDDVRRELWEGGVTREMLTATEPHPHQLYPEILVDEDNGMIQIMRYPEGKVYLNRKYMPSAKAAHDWVNGCYTKAWFIVNHVEPVMDSEIEMLKDEKFVDALVHEHVFPSRYSETHYPLWALEIHGLAGVSSVPGYIEQDAVYDLIKRHGRMPRPLRKLILSWNILSKIESTVDAVRKHFNYGPMVSDEVIFSKHIEPVLTEEQKQLIKNQTSYIHSVTLAAVHELKWFSSIMKEEELDKIIAVF